MERNVVYGFLGGLYVGRFTNLISNFVITGITLFFYNPEIYSYSTVIAIRESSVSLINSLTK